MKTKIFGLVAIVCIAFAASFIANNVSKSSSALSMVAAANVEALAQNPADPYEYQFQEEDEGGITCSSGNSGRCFKMEAEDGLFGICRFFCEFTGYQRDYCSGIKVFLVNCLQMIP